MPSEFSGIEDLASKVAKPADLATTLLVATVLAIDSNVAGRVQTDITDAAWLPCDRDVQLSLGDRVWILKQAGVMLVCGRLVGAPSGTRVIAKSGLSTKSSTITLGNDPDLKVDLFPGSYRIELFAHASSANTSDNGDIRIAWSTTGTMSALARACLGPGEASTNNVGDTTVAGSGIMRSGHAAITTPVTYGITDDATTTIREDIHLVVTDYGRLQMQWAQGTSNATGVTLAASSRMYVTPLLTG